MKPTRTALLLVCALFAAHSAWAQDGISPEKRAGIERLLEASQALALGEQLSNAMVAQMTNVMRASNPNIPQPVLEAIPEVVNEVVADRLPEFVDDLIVIYDRHFTLDDIEALESFYSSEVGKKLVSVQGQLAQESMLAGQTWGQSLGPDIQRRLRERLGSEGGQ